MNSLLNTDQQDQPQIDEAKNYLEELVGDGKKFKSAEELAKGKAYADALIDIQNKRMDDLRADYLKLREEHMTGKSLNDVVTQLRAELSKDRDITPPANDKETPPVFDSTQLKSLVSQEIREHESFTRQEKNFNDVKSKLIEQHGNNHTAVLKRQIDELGMTVEEADRMARNTPKAFIKTFGLDQPAQTEGFNAPPRSNQRSGFTPAVKPRDYAFYQEMRKSKPDLYADPKTQVQMHNDYLAMGDAFGID